MQQRNAVLVNGNALRLGLFGANCSSGRTYATLAERWDASWENNVRLAQLADEVGIEGMRVSGAIRGSAATAAWRNCNFRPRDAIFSSAR